MTVNKENYYKICRAMYEATGMVYWLHKPEFDGQMKANFIVEFNSVFKQLKQFVKEGGVFRYYLIKNKQKVPFIYNSL